jgi:hypothetical protein
MRKELAELREREAEAQRKYHEALECAIEAEENLNMVMRLYIAGRGAASGE